MIEHEPKRFPISTGKPESTNLKVTDDANIVLISVSDDGVAAFNWPAIRSFLDKADRLKPSLMSFVVQAVHAAWVAGIEQGKPTDNAELAARCLKHADILTEDNWHTVAATLRDAAAALMAEVPT